MMTTMFELIRYIESIGFKRSKNSTQNYEVYVKGGLRFSFGRRTALNRSGKHDSYFTLIDPSPVLIIGDNPLLGNDPKKISRIFELPVGEVYQRLISGKPFYFEK